MMYYADAMLERLMIRVDNAVACYENPFVYGLIHTPVNRAEYYDADYDEYEYFMNEPEAFAFIWDQLEEEDDECDDSFANVRTFDLPDRNGFRTNKRSCLREIDFPYAAQTLADLFAYSEGEQFYHSVNADDIPPSYVPK